MTSSVNGSRIFAEDVSQEDFLRDYWQQKPLLIRNAFPDFKSPITPEELAGLACEEGVNARLVIEKDAEKPWLVKHSPFDEDDFSQLPENHWTLLVSDVEKHFPQTRAIKDFFRFIPDWRMDDLMFSYAPENGSVGPHTDAYDVFLLQTMGRRKWMISSTFEDSLIDDIELRILSQFNAEESWVLEPGDILYLPPGIAHHGVATENCMTCSIGFRAPSVRAMMSEFAEYLANETDTSLRYTDPGLESQTHPAEISATALTSIKKLLEEKLSTNDKEVQRWFGEYLSETRSESHNDSPENIITNYAEFESLLKENIFLHQSPTSTFLFSGENNSTLLFVDGTSFTVGKPFAETLCAHHTLKTSQISNLPISNQEQSTLLALYNSGTLYFSNEDS